MNHILSLVSTFIFSLISIFVLILLAVPAALLLNMLDWIAERGESLKRALLRNHLRIPKPRQRSTT
jgi:hypothetical protein